MFVLFVYSCVCCVVWKKLSTSNGKKITNTEVIKRSVSLYGNIPLNST